MANQYVSKVVLGTETLIDLTADTVAADKLLKNVTAHGKDGAPIVGTCEFDSDTSDATAVAAELLSGKTAYVSGNKVTGTMPNRGAVTGTITTKAQAYTIASVTADHAIVVSQASTTALYVKSNGAWVAVTAAYVKANGAWAPVALDSAFDSTKRYRRSDA